jgi:hypothetical protein
MGVTFGGQVDYLYAGGIYLFAVGFGRLESMTYNPTVRTVISTSAALNRSSAMFTAPASGGQGPHYFLGQSGALSTDGTTALAYTASAGSLPAAAIAVWHQQRVFAARLLTSATTDPSSTVVASNIGDPRDWTQGTSQGWTAMFGPGDGDPITAMVGAGSTCSSSSATRSGSSTTSTPEPTAGSAPTSARSAGAAWWRRPAGSSSTPSAASWSWTSPGRA